MRIIAFCALVALALAGCATQPSLMGKHTVLSSSTSDAAAAAAIISAYRVSRGLSPVTVDSNLSKAAEHQARSVAAAGALSHGDFSGRMKQFGVMGAAAENLTAGSSSVDAAVVRWKNSPPHNDNLLMPEAKRIGLARADTNGGYGRYWALVLGQ
ncbi:CAP domain-containing protein [Microvirga alba]|nr:CAP domain-containing protein [Microvirga alba]